MIDDLLRRLCSGIIKEDVSHLAGATFSEMWEQLEPYQGNWITFMDSGMFYGKKWKRVLKAETEPSYPFIFLC